MRMNRPRTPSIAVLPDLTGPPIEGSPWQWSGAEPEASGRLTHPPTARRALIGDADGAAPLTAHVLRHTAVTRVGRIAGHPVAQAFAGHAPPTVTGR
jgi:integrase